MFISQEGNALVVRQQYVTLRIEPWGKDALRVRATKNNQFTDRPWALTEDVSAYNDAVKIEISDKQEIFEKGFHFTIQSAEVSNGKIGVRVNPAGVLTFYKDDKMILREYSRNYNGNETGQSNCLKVNAREFKPIIGGDYKLTVRFDGMDGEHIFGMGQYQQSQMDLKGCTLELAQRNSQISIPFAVSNLGYGFLWNLPAVGRATFGRNYSEWTAEVAKEMDYWITAADTPAQLLENYTAVTGRAPVMSDDYLGLWQCKLRYRTQEEVLTVARKYKALGIPLDVIVIDFFHWTRQGDWRFDKEYWPDPKAMCDELHAMGTKVMVSVWPTVDKKSIHYFDLLDRGLLLRTERGGTQAYDFQGDCSIIDVTNPEAQKFLWETCKKSYYDLGIDLFWLDNIEPELVTYDYDNYRYHIGCAQEVSNIYPQMMAKTFCDGIRHENQTQESSENYKANRVCDSVHKDTIQNQISKNTGISTEDSVASAQNENNESLSANINKEDNIAGMIHLARCGWAGNQKYSTLLWSGDVPSTFEALRDQIAAGLNVGLAGVPWWTTDIGGFDTPDCYAPEFKELLLRWYEFAVYSPVLRMHGNRAPFDIPPLSDKDFGGGYLFTGHDNELWSYGEEAFEIMKNQLNVRLTMKPYIHALMEEAHESGAPIIRAMFFEFPEDEKCWTLSDQYMFGSKYLVAPVLHLGERQREVYLPEGNWKDVYDKTETIYEGPVTVMADAPIEHIPVFERMDRN